MPLGKALFFSYVDQDGPSRVQDRVQPRFPVQVC